MTDVVVIGAGPVGLACAIEAARAGLSAVVIEKGGLVNSLLRYPIRMEFFSTPELVEIGEHAFPTSGYKPVREEAIEYYRRVAEIERLNIRLYERVLRVEGDRGSFRVATDKGAIPAKHVVVAIGFFDRPNMLNVPGEDLPKVTHYYREAYQYSRQKVAVIGAKNSAAKAALDCYRHGADVTLICRQPALSDKIKYWIKPDLENRIKEASIRVLFSTSVEEILERTLVLRTPEGLQEIDNDWVLAMTGYHPDYTFLESLQISIGDEPDRTPLLNEATFETSRPGIYMAGTVCGGYNTSRWFI
ncbi:MAG: YpdA family putative bacillithiol disulfide reductase, partial [Rhodothermales bacterium]